MLENNKEKSHVEKLLEHFPSISLANNSQKEVATKDCGDVVIQVVNSSHDVGSAVNQLIERQSGPCKAFGLDCEWNINHTKGVIPKPDLLQIATTDGYCALFRLNLIKAIPPKLQSFLENPEYMKVGVAVQEDTQKLLDTFGVTTTRVLDVRYLADDEGLEPRGLSTLTKSVLGVPCQKHNWRFHQWTGRLSEEQKRYAAIDAVMGVRIFKELNHRRICDKWGAKWESWSDQEYNDRTASLWSDYFNKPFYYNKSKFIIRRIVNDILRLADLRSHNQLNCFDEKS